MNVQAQFVLTLNYEEYHSLLTLIHYMASEDVVFTREMFLDANQFAKKFGIVIDEPEYTDEGDDDEDGPTLQ